MSKGRTLLGVGVGVVLMSTNAVQADTQFQLQKKLAKCCVLDAFSTDKHVCITQAWADYRAQIGAVAGGGEPSLDATSVSIARTSEGYRGVSLQSSLVYNNLVYQPGQQVDVLVNVNAAAHAHCSSAGVPVACCTGAGTGNCITKMRLVLQEPANNPLPGFCSNGNNTAGPFCDEDTDCGGGNTCTGVRKTCQGGASPGAACANDGNCAGGNTCERTIGAQVDVCSLASNGNTGCTGAGTPVACCTGAGTGTCIGWWACSWTPTQQHAGSLIVEPTITGHNLDVDSDTAMVVAATKIWGIPAVSEWGMVLLTLLVVSAASVVLLRARSRTELA